MYKVIIVENDPMVSSINEEFVNRHKDFEVVEKFYDGQSALKYLETKGADLIITDVFLPLKNGFETLREIRIKQLPVEAVVVTAASGADDLKEALHLGVIDYIMKPFTFERFKKALDKFVIQTEALKDLKNVSQKNIDFFIKKSRMVGDDAYPKGIQTKTLAVIKNYLKNNKKKWLTGEDISEEIGLTSVTVRRYMAYLSETGFAVSKMNYETGGRPGIIYKFSE